MTACCPGSVPPLELLLFVAESVGLLLETDKEVLPLLLLLVVSQGACVAVLMMLLENAILRWFGTKLMILIL